MRYAHDACEVGRLNRRADFLRVAKGLRWHAKTMTVQAVAAPDAGDGARVGFTLTRKVGNAVVRNRVRRRLKEAVRLADGLPAMPGHDYVIVGRIDAAYQSFDRLRCDLVDAFGALRGRLGHRATCPGRGAPRDAMSTETR